MGIAAPVIAPSGAGNNVITFTWALTAANAVGAPIHPQYADYMDRNVQVVGVFGGATVVWQGSNDGQNYETLNDGQGSAISKAAAGLEQVTEGALYQRPSSSGGGGSTDLTVICVIRRNTK
jgi:hypothetical protein